MTLVALILTLLVGGSVATPTAPFSPTTIVTPDDVIGPASGS